MHGGAASTKPRLVVIDDDEQVAITVGRVARKGGYSPTLAHTFAEFKATYDDDVSVVVVDLVMPDIDGVEVIRFLAARKCTAGVILASGYDRRVLKSAAQLAIDRGLRVLGCIGKPFAVKELLELLKNTETAPSTPVVATVESLETEELRRALASDQIDVHFQPKVNLRNGQVVGAEAVARWHHPELGRIAPEQFIALAEESDLIQELTRRVMTAAFRRSATWRTQGRDLHIAVNLSSCSLSCIDLPDRMSQLAARCATRPEDVVVELTESCLSDDRIVAADILTRVRLKGFELSIDDFGTGYATLRQLERLPFSELKLDSSFVRAAPFDPEARAIVESSIELAHALELRVVAEGIESEEHWRLMSMLGAEEAQGHMISAPIPAKELPAWEADWRARSPPEL